MSKEGADGGDAAAFGLYSIYNTEIDLYLQLLSPYNSLTAQACAVEYFRHLLVRDHVPPAPIADTLIKGLIRCLRVDYANIRRDAAWALTNCACSPHDICYKIIEYGGLEALIECATVTSGETRDQVFWTLGNIALDCSVCQRKVRESAALPLMIGLLAGPENTDFKWMRNLVWAMSQILRGGIHSLHIMYIQAALHGLCSVLYTEDPILKVDAAWAVAYIADDTVNGTQIDAVLETPHLLELLMQLLDSGDTVRAALRALGNLVAGGDEQTQAVLDAGLLPRVMMLFEMDEPVAQKREIAWILSNIAAGSQRQIDILFETEHIVEMLIDAFNRFDHRVRKEVGWTVANAFTGASVSRVRWLCGSNLPVVISELLEMQNERELVERTLYAIELLIAKRANYIPVLDSYQIIQSVQKIVQSNSSDDTIRARAESILQEESDFKAHRIPLRTYRLVR